MGRSMDFFLFPGISLDNAVIQELEPGFHFDTHMHHTAEFCLCLEGTLTFQMYRKEIPVSRGQYFLCYPDFLHSASNSGPVPVSVLQMHFRCNPLPDSLPGPAAESVLASELALGQHRYLLHTCSSELEACSRGILRSLRDPDRDLLLPSYLYQLNFFLSRDLLSTGSGAPVYQNRYLKQACSYLYLHYMDPVTVADAAGAAGISERYLNRLFRENLGISVHAYLTHIRVSRAIDFMDTHPGYPLARLALELGFSSQQHFSAVFKSVMTVSPKQYFSARRKNF